MKEVNKAVLLSTCSPTLKITIAEVSKKVIKANNRWSFSLENNYLSLFKKKKKAQPTTEQQQTHQQN